MAKAPKRKTKAASRAGKAKGGGDKRVPKQQRVTASEQQPAPETGWNIGFDPEAQLRDALPPSLSADDLPLPRELTEPRVAAGAVARASTETSAAVLDRLWVLIDDRKNADPELSHAARLLSRGPVRIAQKLGEEAIECAIEIVAGSREGLIGESADVLYHLLLAWVHAGLQPEAVWRELERREQAGRASEGVGPKRAAVKRVLGRVRTRAGTTKIP